MRRSPSNRGGAPGRSGGTERMIRRAIATAKMPSRD
jgi:hypothetical protein